VVVVGKLKDKDLSLKYHKFKRHPIIMMYYNWHLKEVTEAARMIAKSGIIRYTFLDLRV